MPTCILGEPRFGGPGQGFGMTALRIGLAVVAGYASMFVASMIGIGIAWTALGSEWAFHEGTAVASAPWSALMCAFGLAAAAGGGFVAKLAAGERSRGAALALALLVLVLGHGIAFAQLGSEPSPLPEGKTVADLTFLEAGEVASAPVWYNFTIPWIGAVGVLLGAGCRRCER